MLICCGIFGRELDTSMLRPGDTFLLTCRECHTGVIGLREEMKIAMGVAAQEDIEEPESKVLPLKEHLGGDDDGL